MARGEGVVAQLGGYLLVLGLLVFAVLALLVGPTALPPLAVAHALLHPFGPSVTEAIVWQVRLPRVIGACLVGAALGLSGLIFQALLRNPLADPYLIGTSAGASLGATIAETFAPGIGVVSAGSFLGAVGAVFAASLAARRPRGASSVTMVLVGYALSVILGAITSLILTFNHTALVAIFFWQLGGLGNVDWGNLLQILAALLFGVAAASYFRRELDALSLGELRARYLGVDARRTRLWLLLTAGLMTAVTVSAAGLIGFVGLVAPHVARRIAGASHRRAILVTAVGGAAFLLLADTVARSLPTGEIPVGIVTAILGGPFFIGLLLRGTGVRGDTP